MCVAIGKVRAYNSISQQNKKKTQIFFDMYPFLEVGYTCTKYDNHIFRTLVFPAGIATHAVLVMSILLVVFKVQGKADSYLPAEVCILR